MDSSFTTAGARIHYEQIGTGGPNIIFLHYWGGSSRTWRHVTERLADQARCISVDLRGWGRSVALDDRYDLEAMADDVMALAEGLNLDSYFLVGHSMGGKVAQIVARRAPAALAGVVLVAPSPPGGMAVPADVRAGMLASYQSPAGVEQALAVLTHQALAEEDKQQVLADTLQGAPQAKAYWTDAGMLADIGAVAGITAPVLIVVGEQDQVERVAVLRPVYARVLPRADFRTLAGTGHLAPLEAPEAVAQACAEFVSALA
ncbi:alpha/beta fold hydrolase [Bordetella sp. N]|uniref:alpha/beta fold hydrolase n=1 Tax=Bordetella sp. N TaxID=1746199 RepID=UPI00070984C1|nr:alpha/beta hydrolase [Bordetella sp. N]ALM84120.1 hypothetical protein ASB57_15095 [Bordetella sp. N]